MKSFWTLSILVLITTIVFSESACAQLRPRRTDVRKRLNHRQLVQKEMIGIRIGKDFEHETYRAGAQFVLPAGMFWRFVPSFDYYFVENDLELDRWQFNGDLLFQPRPNGLLYFGGGFAVNYLLPDKGNSETEFGGNALLGLQTNPRRPMCFFVQAGWSFFAETEFSLLGGINMQLR